MKNTCDQPEKLTHKYLARSYEVIKSYNYDNILFNIFQLRKDGIKMIKEEQLLEQRELREQLAGRVEVLEKVKTLLLIPQTDIATVKQVADFYEVGEEAIQSLYKDNKNELDDDGVTLKSYKDFLNVPEGQLKTGRGKSTLSYTNGDVLIIPNRGLKVFPRRAILRIGMLLRDSVIAKEVRTQLLNIEEKTTVETKVQDINEEQKLMLEYGMAFASGNVNALSAAGANLMTFKNRHIEKLKQDNKALAGEILKWEERSKMVFAIRKLAPMLHKPIGYVWNNLYKELKYKHHIDVKLRGKKPYIEHVKSHEWSKVIQTFSALCETNNISPSDIFNSIEVSGGQKNE